MQMYLSIEDWKQEIYLEWPYYACTCTNESGVCNLLGYCKTKAGYLIHFRYMAKGAGVHVASSFLPKIKSNIAIIAVSTLLLALQYTPSVHTLFTYNFFQRIKV